MSLSSVQRTLKRCRLLKERSPWKRPHDFTPRPEATFPGALMEVDTLQEECLDQVVHNLISFRQAVREYLPYYNTERMHLGLDYLTPQEVMQRY